MHDGLMTAGEAARAKGVSHATIYAAVAAGRLAHRIILGRIAIHAADLEAYAPTRYGSRPGVKGRGGRPSGRAMGDHARANISEGQQKRWAKRKQQGLEAQLPICASDTAAEPPASSSNT